ncbi:ubiquinol--cytochrome-c reductase subunit 6 [Mucor velutinosus]|uniref:Ubiquinol--cytochrome-c reductase subunit 6 n=1 Tax=Mucor velutinosus TaxID=708070 RepID=A0AAN7HYH5_9FUNG|nr:ubiquinol--cytochrome-c reductase subunit 6 [Mucor velutinosus]
MSFGFGTPTPSSSAFGAGSGGFGTSQTPATTSAFGQPVASATTGFGTQQPSTGGFGFGATSAAPATGGFGQSSTSTAPTTGFGSGFGGNTATSTAPTSGLFGGGGGGFGATTQAQPATSNTFKGFGATATSTAPATGLFGAPAASTAPGTNTLSTGFGGFGANKPTLSLTTPSTTAGTTGGLFGSKPATTSFFGGSTLGTTGTTGFGLNLPQQQNAALTKQREQQVYQLLSQIDQEARAQVAPAINSEDYKPENVWHALALLKSWWDPKSPNCRFQHYFYNVVSPQEAHLYQKPADHDQAAWDAAQAANPDRTTRVPALAIGFDDVQKRMDEQHKLSEAHSAKLAEIETTIKEIQKKSQLETAVKLDEYKRKHMQAAQRVIKFLKYAQVLRNKGLSITPDEEVMRARLENIQAQLQRSEQFHGKLSQLWAQLQFIKESGRKYGKIDGVDEWDAVSEENMRGITKILDEQNNGVQHIIEVIETDTAEVDNLRKGWRAIH